MTPLFLWILALLLALGAVGLIAYSTSGFEAGPVNQRSVT